MVQLLTTFAQEAQAVATTVEAWQPAVGKSILAGMALGAAAIGLGMIGSGYMKALGRNPEAAKVAGQVIIIAAMVEVTALLAFLLSAFLIT